MPQRISRIGLISDTHGLLRPEAVQALEGSELIIHAGDVGKPEVLDALKSSRPSSQCVAMSIAAPWADALPLTATVEPGIYVLHE